MLTLLLALFGLDPPRLPAEAGLDTNTELTQESPEQSEWAPFDVLSENGLYRAELRRAPGYENKPAKFSRWRLTILELSSSPPAELWNAQFAYDGSPQHYLLSNDGLTFVHVSESYEQYRAVLTILERGRELSAPKGNSFRLAREDTPTTATGRSWLAEDGVPNALSWLETPEGPELTLEFHCRGDKRRWVSIRRGKVWTAAEFEALFKVEITPDIPARLAELVTTPNVRGFSVPSVIRAGVPLAVRVRAEYITKGWFFEGFQWEQSGDEGRELVIVPRARRPLNQLVATVIVPFEPTASIGGLVPGTYSLNVIGANEPDHSPVDIEVLPRDLELIVARDGRPGRPDEELRIFDRGELRVRSSERGHRVVYLTHAQLGKIRQALARLPERSKQELGRTNRTGETRLTYWRDHELIEQVRDVTTISHAMTDLLKLLDEIK